jgi:hypothetical protein
MGHRQLGPVPLSGGAFLFFCAFLAGKRILRRARPAGLLRDPDTIIPFAISLLQKGPWQEFIHIFLLVAPIEVIPKPSSSSRRARHVGITFILSWHSESDPSALVRKQSLSERELFPAVLPRSFRIPSWWILHPQASQDTHSMKYFNGIADLIELLHLLMDYFHLLDI